jgi:SH3-like domain-containing protein
MVRDFEGTKGWVEKTSVAEKNCVVVRHEKVNLYGGPSENSEIIADARKGVAFTMEEQAGDWIKVAHESGLTGWLPLSALWGL